jgi:hypothetical protein
LKVSVIIPTRDRPEMLRRAIEGVQIQRHASIELIVVDDTSSEPAASRNAQVVAEAALPCSLVRLGSAGASGSGPSRARNAGLDAATGDLVAFCDDDDFWSDAGYLERAVQAFSGSAKLDLFFGNQAALTNGVLAYERWQPELERIVAPRMSAGAIAFPVSRAECLVSPGGFAHMNTCVFRKSLLEAIGGFSEDIRYCEDLELLVRAVDRARLVVFSPLTVAIHNRPDRDKSENASTALDASAKAALLHAIACRLIERCLSAEAIDYARRLGASGCKEKARAAARAAQPVQALTWARLAWGWDPTWRWGGYTAFLWLRSLGRNLLQGRSVRVRTSAQGGNA